jgi:hypothetical protein
VKDSMTEATKSRFWAKVDKNGPFHPILGTRCWRWTAARVGDGYGQFWLGGKRVGAHRASWVIHAGEPPQVLCVLHRCDNPSCVNPEHLFLGTLGDNQRDTVAKGRHYMGAGRATLTARQVHAIRRRYRPRDKGANGSVALGREFGVSFCLIRELVRGKGIPQPIHASAFVQ